MEKAEILAFIRGRLQEQAELCLREMDLAQESANSEEKSSAGDKYETGRAMSQQQREFFARRFDEARANLAVLDSFSGFRDSGRVQNGCLVQAEGHYFFLGSGMGLLDLPHGEKLICITSNSPLGKSMLGKRPGDDVLFSGRKIRIDAIS